MVHPFGGHLILKGDPMKRIYLLLLTLITISFSSHAGMWWATAVAADGTWGTGWAGSLYQAKQNALYECASRTTYTCYITRTWWE